MPIPEILDEGAVSEIKAMFPHAEYQPTLSPDEVDPCEFCKGTIDDHKANCVVPHVHALCATVKHLRAENQKLMASRRVHELDNHHNALACGYCAGPLKDELTRLRSQLEKL